MTQYLPIQEWIDETFSNKKRPHINTVRRWIKNGDLTDTQKFGRTTYILAGARPDNSGATVAANIARIAEKL
jgi:hypothetical protein